MEEKVEAEFYKNPARATKAFLEQNFHELSDLSETEAHGGSPIPVAN